MFGAWTNEGPCTAGGVLSTCGPGKQKQIRTCIDGTVDKCTDIEKQRVIACSAAGTQLPACPTGDIFATQLSILYKCYYIYTNSHHIFYAF